MPTVSKETTVKKGFAHGTVSDDIKSRAQDPFVLKKVEEAAKTIQRVGLPGSKK
jgi:hypothetical protein